MDALLVERGLAKELGEAAALVMSGRVRVGGERCDKPGTATAADAAVEVVPKAREFASRGAGKLETAFSAWNLSAVNRVCADVGCSTGGFTDVLLRRGAAKVYAIDVAHGELDFRLRSDPRVAVMERTNATQLERLPELVSLVTIDVSLLPLSRVLPSVRRWLAPDGEVVALVKPQYEARSEELPPGAVIVDRAVHREILLRALASCREAGFEPAGLIASATKGHGGNQEFLCLLRVSGTAGRADEDLVREALDGR